MAVSTAVLVFYTVTGGIVASVYTDLIQGTIMVVAAVLVFATVLSTFDGGLAEMSEVIAADDREVQGRLGDTNVAFARARAIFLLGVLQAFAFGVVVTSLLGRFMVSRNWPPEVIECDLLGQLPRVAGLAEPFMLFPSAVMVMTFLSFFIGVFLQLMWEELPITEPL